MGLLTLVVIGLLLGTSFVASRADSNVKVKCNGTHMEVQLTHSYISGRDSRNLHLNDPACRATATSNVVSLRTALNACGTKYKNYTDTLEFENEVKDDQKYVDPNKEITRQTTILLRIYCKYARGQYVGVSYEWRTTTPAPTTTSAANNHKVTWTKGFWVFVVISLSLALILSEYQL